MKSRSTLPVQTEINKASQAGFHLIYHFADGLVHCMSDPENVYYPKDLAIKPKPCLIDEVVVYLIDAPCGKGIATVPFPDKNDF